jgi:ribonuclease P protein component
LKLKPQKQQKEVAQPFECNQCLESDNTLSFDQCVESSGTHGCTVGDGDRHPHSSELAIAIATPVKDSQLAPTKIGISISQKVSKRAVVRNRIKRQLKAAIRSLLPHMNAGWLLVIVVRPSAIQCDYWQFLQELKQMLKMTEVLNGYP